MQPQMFEGVKYPVRAEMAEAFADIWRQLAESGPFWSGRDRMAIVEEARQSLICELCAKRLEALSPNAVQGEHDTVTHLAPQVVEVIHRIRTDPARMSKSVFDTALSSGMSQQEYVELVGVVATSVVIDTVHNALGLDVPPTLEGSDLPPVGQADPDLVDAGAWVPISPRDGEISEAGIPRTANIIRAMGLVPAIIRTFFMAMRQTYFISNLPFAVSRSQAEFIAARVSALNQCFY